MSTTGSGAGGLSMSQILSIRPFGGSEAPRWTPDGSALTFVAGIGGASEVWSITLADGLLSRITTGLGGVGHLASFRHRWSPTGEYMSNISAKSGNDEVWLWPVDGSSGFQLTALASRIEAYSWAPDGQSIALASNRNGAFNVYRVTVPSGEMVQLTDDELYETYPTFLPDGRILYVRLNDLWTDHDVILMNADGSDKRVVLQDTDFFDYHYGRSFSHPIVAQDGRSFLFPSFRSGWQNYWLAPIDGNADPQPIAAAEADQTGASWSPDGKSVLFLENRNGTIGIRVVDIESGKVRQLVTPELGVCSGAAWSPDGTKISYLLGTPTTPNDIWIVDVASGEQRQLTRSLTGLGSTIAERLVTPEKISYTSFDGLEIPAYLYRPPIREGTKYPGIIWVHGGPTSQYSDTWQPQVQWFVQQGYVILLPNIRGSSGYGKAFEAANDRDWGGGDLKDCIAGADYLRSLPDVDADSIGITGTSYGGTMSFYAVTFSPPGTFQAAISASGYCDFVRGFDERELRSQKMYEYELGERTPENWKRFSSLYYVDQVTTPTFVLHGQGRYPGSVHAKEFALALEANYKPVWYKAYPGENYYVTGAKVPELLRDMKAFFDLYLKGIPHTLPNDATRPLTHLSGTISPPSGGLLTQPITSWGKPGSMVAASNGSGE